MMPYALIPFVIFLDQLSKWAVLDAVKEPIEITFFLNFVLVMNKGVSFGLFSAAQAPTVLIILTGALSAALLVWMVRAPERLIKWALGLIIGGALGNIIDRLRFGAVVDFIDVHAGAWHWPAFNIADSAIVLGAALLALQAAFAKEKTSE